PAEPIALRRARPVLAAIAVDLEVVDHADAALAQVQHETHVGLAQEGCPADRAGEGEFKARWLDALLEHSQQFVVGSAQLEGLEAVLAGPQGEVAALWLDLTLEDRAELKLGRHGAAVKCPTELALHVGIEGRPDRHRRLLWQSRGSLVGKVSHVKLFDVFLEKRQRRIGKGAGCSHSSGPKV